MGVQETITEERPKGRGEVYEGIAFQFCKVATVALIAGRFALPLAAGLCAIFYVLAWSKGKRHTRCVLEYPLLIALFWGIVSALALIHTVRPEALSFPFFASS
ncbi:MAG: hypothetical protein ACO1SV_06750 [Fimbriimonas sp.]